jgi:hypothetical protein
MLKAFGTLFITLIFAIGLQGQTSYFIKNTNYINLQKGIIEPNVSVLVKANQKPTLVNNKKITPKGKTVIDAQGQYFMEALQDMHIHWPDTLYKDYFALVKQAGIGSVRVMKSNAQTISESKSITSMQFNISYPVYSKTYMPNPAAFVDSIYNAGYHFIKTFSIANQATFIALAKAAKAKNMVICGHALDNISPKICFENGYKSVEHVGYLSKCKTPEQLDSTIALFKKYEVSICPTLDWVLMAYHKSNKDSFLYRAGYNQSLNSYSTIWDKAYKEAADNMGTNQKDYANYAENDINKKLNILKKCQSAGINIILGSDAEEPYQVPGFSLIEEMKILLQAGFSSFDVIKMATLNAHKYYSQIKNNNANKQNQKYILLQKNPIEDINNLATLSQLINLN